MAVRRPDGLILDITGVHERRAWLDGWNAGFKRNTVVFVANDPGYRSEQDRLYSKSPRHWAKKLVAATETAELR